MMFSFSLLFLNSSNLIGQVGFEIESGIVSSGYNDVRIPGDTGTLFSLSEDLTAETSYFYRVRLNYLLNSKHFFSVLYAPLTIKSDGDVNKDIRFRDLTFPANTPLDATYTFNSYRLTYRYELYKKEFVEFGIGVTGKIRDANIGLKSATQETTKDNLGFVPLINFRLFVKLVDNLGFLLTGDALAAPQGRAEDVLAALTYGISDKFKIKLGYRILEGGADNDEVYTFSLINYAVVGLMIQL